MKTQYLVAALRAANTPAAKLSRYLQSAATPAGRLFRHREAMARKYSPTASIMGAFTRSRSCDSWELSSPEADSPLLWISPKDSRVTDWQGREFLDHRGWYQDEFQDETLETCAVILTPFPWIVFYAVRCSMSGDYRVHLDEWEEIDFSGCQSDRDAEDARRDTVKSVIRGNDSATQREAEESIEFYRKDRIEMEIAENRETLKTLRKSIRALAGELKALCPSPLATEYPSAAQAVRTSLSGMLNERASLMKANQELAGSI